MEKVLTLTNKTKTTKTSYTIHGEQLESINNAKYIGVALNKKLKWNAHVSDVQKLIQTHVSTM